MRHRGVHGFLSHSAVSNYMHDRGERILCHWVVLLCVQLTIIVWAEPKIKRPGASHGPIVHLVPQSTQVAGETTP